MEGHIARLPDLSLVAKEFNTFTILDDAHGVGVLGDKVRGTANHFGLTDEVDVICGSFSKSFSGLEGLFVHPKMRSIICEVIPSRLFFPRHFLPSATACAHAALRIFRMNLNTGKDLKKIWLATAIYFTN